MSTHTRAARSRRVLLSLPLLGLLFAPGAGAQITTPDEMAVDPDLPRKEGFDAERAFLGSEPIFTPLRHPEFEPLREALRRGDLNERTTMLAFEAGGRTLALVSSQMSYHHVAQGEMAGEPWMVTF